MLYLYLKLWFKNRTDRFYYMRTNVPHEHVKDAVKFLYALKKIDYDDSMFERWLESSTTYAEYMLGHYVLNAVANISLSAFIKVMNQVPLMYRLDDDQFIQWIGRRAMQHSDTVLSTGYATEIAEEVFGIHTEDSKKVYVNQHTKNELSIIRGDNSWENYITVILNNRLNILERDVDAFRFSKINNNLESIKRRITAYMQVSEAYSLTDYKKRIQKLYKNVYGEK